MPTSFPQLQPLSALFTACFSIYCKCNIGIDSYTVMLQELNDFFSFFAEELLHVYGPSIRKWSFTGATLFGFSVFHCGRSFVCLLIPQIKPLRSFLQCVTTKQVELPAFERHLQSAVLSIMQLRLPGIDEQASLDTLTLHPVGAQDAAEANASTPNGHLSFRRKPCTCIFRVYEAQHRVETVSLVCYSASQGTYAIRLRYPLFLVVYDSYG